MKIITATTANIAQKQGFTTRVDLHKAADMFGECDGVTLSVEQVKNPLGHCTFVHLVMSADEARNLGNRLIEAYGTLLYREQHPEVPAIANPVGKPPFCWPNYYKSR